LFRNESENDHHWLALRLIGVKSNRDGIGAKIKLTAGSGAVQFNQATTSVGYASTSDRRVHFGLGRETKVKSIEVRWPSGKVQVLKDVEVDRELAIREDG
jgi:hypothetical protein